MKIYKDENEKKSIESLPKSERDLKLEEINDIYVNRTTKYKNYINKRVEWIRQKTKEELSKENELRKNIRVLIILGSSVERITLTTPPYIKHNEDIVTTLLLNHLFKFACAIPEEQIFMASSNPNNFPKSPNVISSLTSLSKDDPNPLPNYIETEDVFYSNPNEFRFFQTVFAQVGDKQYHFHPGYPYFPSIHPFNKESLRTFKTDENSELFVFFLDHRTPGYFQNRNYEFFVERLLEIPSKHVYIFNQSCNSGSLIDLIHISDKILELFFDESSSPTIKIQPTEIFTMLMNASHPTSKSSTEDGANKNEDIAKTHTTESKEIDYSPNIKKQVENENEKKEKKISEIMKYLVKTSDTAKDELISLIDHMSIYDSDLSINPLLFHKLKEKSFILCSSLNNLKSPTLPYRNFYIGEENTISSHGGFFSSVIIECLFHPNEYDINPKDFISHVQTIHNNLKTQFFPILKEQFTFTPTSEDHIQSKRNLSENTFMVDCQQHLNDLESYFNINYETNNTYICPDNIKLPNMRRILLPEKYWNVDITSVDVHEYANLKIYDYNYIDQEYIQTKEGYGPIKGTNNLYKLLNDFSDCLEHKIHSINPSFAIDWDMKQYNENHDYSDITKYSYHIIQEKMQHIFTPNIHRAFDKLKTIIQYQLEYDFKTQPNLYISCCVETLEQILPLYKTIEFSAF